MQEVSYCHTAFISPEVYNPSSLKGAERTQDVNLPPLEKTLILGSILQQMPVSLPSKVCQDPILTVN